MDYIDFLAEVHRRLAPETYLEIGTQHGRSLALSRCKSVAVDPEFLITEPLDCHLKSFSTESDAFFADGDLRVGLRRDGFLPADLALIDGMHLSENVLRDVYNTEDAATATSVIVIDDIFPQDPAWATRERQTRAWTGDVWKIIPMLTAVRPDLVLIAVDTEPSGLLLVLNLAPGTEALRSQEARLLAHFGTSAFETPPGIVLDREGAVDPGRLLGSGLLERVAADRASCAGCLSAETLETARGFTLRNAEIDRLATFETGAPMMPDGQPDGTDRPFLSAARILGWNGGAAVLAAHGIRQVAEVPGQSYGSTPPRILGEARFQSGWQDRAHAIYNRPEGVLPPAMVLEVEDAILWHFGQVLTRSGHILEDIWHRSQPRTRQLPETVPLATETGRLLRKPGDANYGHWMVELLPRLHEAALGSYPGDLLIPANPMSMLELRRVTTGALSEDRICPVKQLPHRIGRLMLLSHNSIHSHTHDSRGVRLVRKRLLETLAGDRLAPFRRLFVARGERFKRELTNQPAVAEALAREGFEIVYPETLSLCEQVRLFSEATTVVGVAGAALTNFLWAPAGARVLELQNGVSPEFFFWDIANIAELDYAVLYGQAENSSAHSAFAADLDMIKRWLDLT